MNHFTYSLLEVANKTCKIFNINAFDSKVYYVLTQQNILNFDPSKKKTLFMNLCHK